MFGWLQAAGLLLVIPSELLRSLLRVREIGGVVLVEFLEQRVIGVLELVNGIAALRVSDDRRIAIESNGGVGNKGIVANFEFPELVALLPRIRAPIRLAGRVAPDDLFLGEVGHVFEGQAASIRTGHVEQLSVEANRVKYRVTKRDLERIALAAARHQAEGLRIVQYRVGSKERRYCELRIGDKRGPLSGECTRPQPGPADVRVPSEENKLAGDSYQPEIHRVVTALALARLVRAEASRHQIGAPIRACDQGPDFVARSNAIEPSFGQRDAEDAKHFRWSCVLHARQPGGFRSLPPCVDGVDGRGRRGSGGGGGRDGGGLIGSCPGRVPLAGRNAQRDQ